MLGPVRRALNRNISSLKSGSSNLQKRNFARESKKSFQAPPDPPSSTLDKIRWPLLIAMGGGFTYIFFLPSNDHGLFDTHGAEAPTATEVPLSKKSE